MTLKEKIEKAKKVETIRNELSTYELAITTNGKFTKFYRGKMIELKAKLDAI
jgi:hypothetical protein|tara:strand:+ start:976 stop:1131 length:156 start_codon:yes stop_codon:yes gene_type:complete